MSDGEDTFTKTVKPFGNGAHVILPKELIDETVRVIYPANNSGLMSETDEV